MKKILGYSILVIIVAVGVLAWNSRDRAEKYTPENAIAMAQPELEKYAAEHHVPLKEFKGPYLFESKGLDFPTYFVCYKHPKHYFCYDHYAFQADAISPSKVTEKSDGLFGWLKQQE